MAVTANIISVVQDPDVTVVNVLYTDGQTFKTQKEYRLATFNLEDFKSQVRTQINQLSQTSNAAKILAAGPFDPAAVASVLTNQQQRQAAYFQAAAVRQQVLTAISLGSMSPGDALDTNSLSAVKGAFALINSDIQASIDAANAAVKAAPIG